MRLSVKQNNQTIKDVQFAKGPISIGRKPDSHLCLAGSTVSKEHAVIFSTDDGKWFVEDLNSANKTYLNDKPIQKTEIKTGDCIRITNFFIEINFEAEDTRAGESGPLEDTFQLEAALTTPVHETVVRRPDAHHAPAMRLAARRLTQFSKATEELCMAENLDALLTTLVNIISDQFNTLRVWCAFRQQPTGPMTLQAGKKKTGQKVELSDLNLNEKIAQAVEKGQSLVMPRVSAQMEEKERIRSAMIATIMRPTGCFGVLYADNSMLHEHYSLSDLDYLMLIAMHTAAIMRNHGVCE